MKVKSGYTIDPFVGHEPLDEKTGRREAIVLSEDEIDRLEQAARNYAAEAPAHYKVDARQAAAAVGLYIETASRLDHILRMKKAWIGEEYISFPSQKEGRPRRFPIRGRLARILASIPEIPGETTWVFGSSKSKRGVRDNIRKAWATICKKAGLPKINIHDLRHTAATAEFEAGAEVGDVARMLGHTTPKMANDLYIKLNPKPIVRRWRAQKETEKPALRTERAHKNSGARSREMAN